MNTKKYLKISEIAKSKNITTNEIISLAIDELFFLYCYSEDSTYFVVMDENFCSEYKRYTDDYLKISPKAIRATYFNSNDQILKPHYLHECYTEEPHNESFWKNHPPPIMLDNLLMDSSDIRFLDGPSFRHSENFREVYFYETLIELNEREAWLIKFLYEQFEKGSPYQTNGDIIGSLKDSKLPILTDERVSKFFHEEHPIRKIGLLKVDNSNKNHLYYLDIKESPESLHKTP